MGLLIANIVHPTLRKLAYTLDKDDSMELESKEYTKFKSEATKLSDISDEDFNQAMGLYISNPASKAEKPAKSSSDYKDEVGGQVSTEEYTAIYENEVMAQCPLIYKVEKGDTWSSLAKKFGFTDKFPTLKEAIHALQAAIARNEGERDDLRKSDTIQREIDITNIVKSE